MSGSKNLTIFQMNDSHAYFDLHQEIFWQGNNARPYEKSAHLLFVQPPLDKTGYPELLEGVNPRIP